MAAFGNLRTRLIASHLAVIGLVFVLTILVASVPIRRAQQRAEESRLMSEAENIAVQTTIVTRPNAVGGDAAVQTVLERQAARTSSQILLASADGTIAFDSAGDSRLVGTRIAGLASQIERLRTVATAERRQAPLSRAIVPVGVAIPIPKIDRRVGVVATTTTDFDDEDALFPVVLARSRRVPVVDRFVRPLLFSAGLAIAVGIGASLLLARSISRPIATLTGTARAVSAGNLDLRARDDGNGEVGTLVHAFNDMLDRLAAASASQRTLLANIAHELRTPLTSIQGYARALRDGVIRDDGDRQRALEVIGDETTRIDRLVTDVLQLSRLESRQLTLRREAADLGALVGRSIDAVRAQATSSGVTLRLSATDRLVVSVDPELLRQAVDNLVTNAVQHTPSGGTVTVEMRQRGGDDGRRLARIAVTDTGAGIAPADLPHVFDRFYRGGGGDEPTGVPQTGHVGLGLSIAREIVVRHGGDIEVTSTLGSGTTFTIELPIDGRATDVSHDDTN